MAMDARQERSLSKESKVFLISLWQEASNGKSLSKVSKVFLIFSWQGKPGKEGASPKNQSISVLFMEIKAWQERSVSNVSTVFLIFWREMKPRKNGAYIIVGKIHTLEKEITNSRGHLCSSNTEIWISCTTEISFQSCSLSWQLNGCSTVFFSRIS